MPPRSTRPRRAIALAAVLLCAAGLDTIPAPTQAATPPSRPELGFRIGRTPHAASAPGSGGTGSTTSVTTAPSPQEQRAVRLPPAHRVTRVPGAGLTATERVAWVVSTYGGTSDRTT